MLLPNFAFNVIDTGNWKNNNKSNISMMFKYILFDDFESMLLQKLEWMNEMFVYLSLVKKYYNEKTIEW